MVPAEISPEYRVLHCCQLDWKVERGHTLFQRSWLCLVHIPQQTGGVLHIFNSLSPMVIDAETMQERKPANGTTLYVRGAAQRLILSFQDTAVGRASLSDCTAQLHFLITGGQNPSEGGALTFSEEANRLREAVEARVAKEESEPQMRKMWRVVKGLPVGTPSVLIFNRLSSRFFELEGGVPGGKAEAGGTWTETGGFIPMGQHTEGPQKQMDEFVDAWGAFMSRMLDGHPPTEAALRLGAKISAQQLQRLLVLALDLRVLLPPAVGTADRVLDTLASWCAPLHAPHPGQTERGQVQEEYAVALMTVLSAGQYPLTLPATCAQIAQWARSPPRLPALYAIGPDVDTPTGAANAVMPVNCEWWLARCLELHEHLRKSDRASRAAEEDRRAELLQLRMLLDRDLAHVIVLGLELARDPSIDRFTAKLKALPQRARQARYEIDLSPAGANERIRGIVRDALPCFESLSNRAAALTALQSEGLLQDTAMLFRALLTLWDQGQDGRTLVRDAFRDALAVLESNAGTMRLPLVDAVQLLLMQRECRFNEQPKGKEAEKACECVEALLTAVGHASHEVSARAMPLGTSKFDGIPLLSDKASAKKLLKLVVGFWVHTLAYNNYETYQAACPLAGDDNCDAWADLPMGTTVSADGRPPVAFFRGSSDLQDRSAEMMTMMLTGLWDLALQMDAADVFSHFAPSSVFYQVYLARGRPIRPSFAKLLRMHANVHESFCNLIADGDDDSGMMVDPEFFCGPVLRALQSRTMSSFDSRLYCLVAQMGCRLRNFTKFDARVANVMKEAAQDSQRAKLFSTILEHAMRRPKPEFYSQGNTQAKATIALEALYECAVHGADAARFLLRTGGRAQSDLGAYFAHVLDTHPPSTWLKHFKDSGQIAFFMKYVNLQDLDLAKERYRARIAEDASPLTTELFERASSLFEQPLVNMKLLKPSDGGATEEVIQGLLARAQTEGSMELRLLTEITANWMRQMVDKGNPPMTPHHTQVLTMLVFSSFYSKLFSQNARAAQCELPHALIAQVATGEGKSMVIAMLTIFLVKGHGVKVHVLENNEGLLDSDFAMFKPFFDMFTHSDGRPITCHNGADYIDPNADINYCLKPSLGYAYLEGTKRGEYDVSSTILIVDEVDSLIVDERPYTRYVREDSEKTAAFRASFKALKRGSAARPESVPDEIWEVAVDAKRDAERMVRNVDYMRKPTGYIILHNGQEPRGSTITPWLQYMNYRDFGVDAYYQSSNFGLSIPYMFKKYFCIYGLTGSIGRSAEKTYLRSVYDAACFSVPLFLDTCRGTKKQMPKCLKVELQQTEREQIASIVADAEAKHKSVPVIIITQNMQELEKVYKAVEKRLGEAVQLFAQSDFRRDNESMQNAWGAIVDRATKRRDAAGGGYWVTVTDPWGGRGHDFKCLDEDVHRAGGVMIIVTSVPQEREWIQWKGRTARQDAPGQFEVVLSREQAPFNGDGFDASTADGVEQDVELVEQLLEHEDKLAKKKLRELEVGREKGDQLAEMCDVYYAKNPHTCKTWPRNDKDRVLLELLGQYHARVSDDELRRAAASLGILCYLSFGKGA